MQHKVTRFFYMLGLVMFSFFIVLSAKAAVYIDIDNDGTNETCYIVDKDHSNASNSWSKSQNDEDHPWKNAWYGAKQLVAGEVLLIKQGVYSRYTGHRYLPGIRPAASGTPSQPIIIRNYPGHDVYIVGGTPDEEGGVEDSPQVFSNPAIGTYGQSYIRFIGLKVYGCITLWSTTGSHIENCNIWGGNDKEFGCCVRLEDAHNCVVVNNRIHDNVIAGDGGGGALNSPLLMEYDNFDGIIEHNYFYNSVGFAVRLKDHPVRFTIRFNVFENNFLGGISASNQDNPNDENSMEVYQNVFTKCGNGILLRVAMTDVSIYNNVFYENDKHIAVAYDDFRNINIYNNIFYNGETYYQVNEMGALEHFSTADHNCFYGGNSWKVNWEHVAGDLGSWKSWLTSHGYGGKEVHSIESDPLFVAPANGDFHLQSGSPCAAGGKDSNPMGCYITGSEVIGPDVSGHVDGEGGDDNVELNIQITSPTTAESYETDAATINIAGTASSSTEISRVLWRNNQGGSEAAIGRASWTISNINLSVGENIIVVTVEDPSGNTRNDSITINRTTPDGEVSVIFGDSTDANYPNTLQDSFLNINNDVNATKQTLNTYTWPTDRVANAIVMKWDLSALPADAEIQNAILYLYLESSGGDDQYEVSVHKIINYDPNIAQCNGYTYDGTNGWTPNTQCYNNIPLAQADIAQAEDTKAIDKNTGYKTWNVTQMVRDWISNPSSNYGLLLNSDKTASADSYRYFTSTDVTDASRRPKLVITYKPNTTPPTAPRNFSVE